MSFLTIPSQEGLFTTITTRKSAEEADGRSPLHDEDDDSDEDDVVVHLIPRCSPVPRKRGSSIHDETAEYMRIHLALSAGKRVSFADTTGGDLIDVKEFVAYDSDEEEDGARWEEEEAKYRKPPRQPTYRVHPEFGPLADGALLQAVRTNKVEVERVSTVENEPLAFSGVIRVLNVSFHKAVYIRSTMDNWATYFDHPAEYVHGSHDGGTDQFSFKLSFAPPYVTHGSRIEFVVRYETSDGDYWANNSSMNYAVTLLLSYEDDSDQRAIIRTQTRGILKPPKAYSVNDDFDSEDEQEKGAEAAGLVRPIAVRPDIVQPEIDIEIAVRESGASVLPDQEPPFADDTPSPGGQFPCMSPETSLQTNSSGESVHLDKSKPPPRLHCELSNQASEQPIPRSPCALASAVSRQQEPRSDGSQVHRQEIPPETSLGPATGEDGSTDAPTGRLEPPAVSGPSGTRGFEVAAGSSEDSTRPAAAESPPGGEAPPPPGLTENRTASPGVAEASLDSAPQCISAWEAKRDAPQISPDLPNASSERVCEPERDVSRILTPAVILASGLVSLSIVLQVPSALFFIGLLLVLRRL